MHSLFSIYHISNQIDSITKARRSKVKIVIKISVEICLLLELDAIEADTGVLLCV